MHIVMATVTEYRGRRVTVADVEMIRELIASHPGASRRALSKKLCEAWGWVQPNGTPCDMQCRSLMLMLHRAGASALTKTDPVALTRIDPPLKSVLQS